MNSRRFTNRCLPCFPNDRNSIQEAAALRDSAPLYVADGSEAAQGRAWQSEDESYRGQRCRMRLRRCPPDVRARQGPGSVFSTVGYMYIHFSQPPRRSRLAFVGPLDASPWNETSLDPRY